MPTRTHQLIKHKSPNGLAHEQQAIKRIKSIYIPRGATSQSDIIRIDKEAMKKYIESEGYGE